MAFRTTKRKLTKAQLERAEKKLMAKRKSQKGFDAKKFSGKLKGAFGDPIAYQKKLRNEWK